jgi:hypothetical protein
MKILGVDVGQKGGIVLLDHDRNILFKSVMPIVENGDLDKTRILEIFINLKTQYPDMHVYMERIIPFALNAKAALTFGRMIGMMEWILWSNQIPHTFVEAAKWSKLMHEGINKDMKSKAKSLMALERLFPGVDLRANEKCKIQHDGLVDALLISAYGLRASK